MKQSQNIGTCIVLVNHEGKILLGKRKNAYKAGTLGLPGGRIEFNEPLSVALVREVAEETGFAITDFEYVGVVRETQEEYEFIHFVFTAQVGDAEPKLCEPDKCEGWQWVDLDSDFTQDGECILGEILPGHEAGIELFINKNRLADLTH